MCTQTQRIQYTYNGSFIWQTDQESEAPRSCVEDIMLIPSQVNQLLLSMKESQEARTRRKVRRDIDVNRWQLPIRYKVDGNLSE